MVRAAGLALLAALAAATAAAQTTVDKQACQKDYGAKVAACAQNLNFLDLITRAGAQKACVQSAKMARDVCLVGGTPPPTCQESCLAAYNNSLASCQATYDPSICGGNFACEQFFAQQQAICIGDALNVLNTCTGSCPIQ
jgi:hypothetical protein